MFTVCPKCGLTLSITARDLRAAQGHVRCGRCQNVFNALDSLSDEHPHSPPTAATLPEEADTVAPLASAAQPPEQPCETDLSRDALAVGEISVDFDPGQAAEPQEPEPSARSSDPTPPSPTAQTLQPQPPEPLPEALQPEPPLGSAFELESAPHRAPLLWTVGTVVLAFVLVAQIVNHYRDTLTTYPYLEHALRTAYGEFGIQLTPDWNVHAYEARQLGATVSGTNPREITVKASIANRAHRPQPLPLLRVTLQNRFGRSIAARDVRPRDYLPAMPSPPLIAAGGRIDASVVFISPSPQAVGFVIDACLPEGHTVVCAHGP